MHYATRPLWLVGFRPFFALACMAGAGLPLIWVLMFSGSVVAPAAVARRSTGRPRVDCAGAVTPAPHDQEATCPSSRPIT